MSPSCWSWLVFPISWCWAVVRRAMDAEDEGWTEDNTRTGRGERWAVSPNLSLHSPLRAKWSPETSQSARGQQQVTSFTCSESPARRGAGASAASTSPGRLCVRSTLPMSNFTGSKWPERWGSRRICARTVKRWSRPVCAEELPEKHISDSTVHRGRPTLLPAHSLNPELSNPVRTTTRSWQRSTAADPGPAFARSFLLWCRTTTAETLTWVQLCEVTTARSYRAFTVNPHRIICRVSACSWYVIIVNFGSDTQ